MLRFGWPMLVAPKPRLSTMAAHAQLQHHPSAPQVPRRHRHCMRNLREVCLVQLQSLFKRGAADALSPLGIAEDPKHNRQIWERRDLRVMNIMNRRRSMRAGFIAV